VLSRRAARLAKQGDTSRALSGRRLPKDSLHPAIQEDVWSLYHRGKYETAVFEAMKAVEVAVRDAAGLGAGDIGNKLVRKAFDVKNGPLTDMSVEEGERQARSDLFAGRSAPTRTPTLTGTSCSTIPTKPRRSSRSRTIFSGSSMRERRPELGVLHPPDTENRRRRTSGGGCAFSGNRSNIHSGC
jgi:uncharacterized protein (TIGR02391 family)